MSNPAASKAYYDRNRHDEAFLAKQRAKQRARRRGNPSGYLLVAAKARAKRLGIPLSIREEDIVIPEVCPILGIPLYPGEGGRSDHSPSLDRKDNSRGYVSGNVEVVSWRANRLKSDGTLEELKRITQWMEGGTK